jgi:hypothetical protein
MIVGGPHLGAFECRFRVDVVRVQPYGFCVFDHGTVVVLHLFGGLALAERR